MYVFSSHWSVSCHLNGEDGIPVSENDSGKEAMDLLGQARALVSLYTPPFFRDAQVAFVQCLES